MAAGLNFSSAMLSSMASGIKRTEVQGLPKGWIREEVPRFNPSQVWNYMKGLHSQAHYDMYPCFSSATASPVSRLPSQAVIPVALTSCTTVPEDTALRPKQRCPSYSATNTT